MNINRKGIKKLTDLPIPLITPSPTIKHVVMRKRECQKINFPGEEVKSKKYLEESFKII